MACLLQEHNEKFNLHFHVADAIINGVCNCYVLEVAYDIFGIC